VEDDPFVKYTRPGWNTEGQPPDIPEGGEDPFAKYVPGYRKPSQTSRTKDFVRQLGVGAVRGVEMGAGAVGSAQHSWDQGWGGMINRGVARAGAGAYKLFGGDPKKADEFVADIDKLNPIGEEEGDSYNGMPTASGMLKAGEAVHGALPEPETDDGKYGRTIGEFVPFATNPAGAFKQGVRKGIWRAATDLTVGAAVPGAVSEAAGQATEGTPFESAARFGAGLLGGAGAAGVRGVAGAAREARVAQRQLNNSEGQMQLAGQRIADAANAETAAKRARLADQLETEPVGAPGVHETTAQRIGTNSGLYDLEERMRGTDAGRRPFAALAESNNQRLTNALEGMEGQTSAGEVSQQLRALRDDMARRADQAVEAERARARASSAAIPDEPAQTVGQGIRATAQDWQDRVRRYVSGLYGIAEKHGVNAVDHGPLLNKVDEVYRPDLFKEFTAPEVKLAEEIRSSAGQMPTLKQLDSLAGRISREMREANKTGDRQVYGRLTQVRSAIEQSIDDTIAARIARENSMVAAGRMMQEDTLGRAIGRYHADSDLIHVDARAAGVGGPPSGPSGYASTRIPRDPALQDQNRPEPGTGGRRSPAGLLRDLRGRDVSGSGERSLGVGARALRRARGAARMQHEVFDQGPLDDILAPGRGVRGSYGTPESDVPGKVWIAGRRGGETIQQFLRGQQAARRPADQALQQVSQAAALSLRNTRGAFRPDGTLDPAVYKAWAERHKEALNAHPQLKQVLGSVQRASETLDATAKTGAQKIANFEKGAVADLIGLRDSSSVTKVVGSIMRSPDPVQNMRELAQRVGRNPDGSRNETALRGLRRAIVEDMMGKIQNKTDMGVTGGQKLSFGQMRSYLKQNRAAMATVFPSEQIRQMDRILAQMGRLERSRTATVSVQGGPGTAEKILAQGHKMASTSPSFLDVLFSSQAMGETAGAVAGSAVGAPGVGAMVGRHIGSGYALAKFLLGKSARAGLATVDDLVAQGMMDPQFGAMLLRKVPLEFKSVAHMKMFANSFERTLLASMNSANAPRGEDDGQ